MDAGDLIYSGKLVRAVSCQDVDIVCLGFKGPPTPESDAVDDKGVKWRAVNGTPASRTRAMLSALPLECARFATREYRELFKTLVQNEHWDLIAIDYYGVGWALDELNKLPKRPNAKVIYVSHNFETDLSKQIAREYQGNMVAKAALAINAFKTSWLEKRLTRECDLVSAITKADGEAYLALGARRNPLVLRPGYEGYRTPNRTISADTPRKVVVLGSYRWIAKQMNLEAFLETADPVFAEAGVSVDVIGDIPGDFVERWRNKLQATQLRGFVDDLQAELTAYRMGLVIEAVGGGFKLKILDYAFNRLPIVAILAGVAGAEDLHDHFELASDFAELAEKVIATIDDFNRLNAMHSGAFDVAEGAFDWDKNARTILDNIK
ncbi:MAG: glycosyltransferase [Pseudomonadota bacterium]